eukprot:1806421-Prymnesium_polylepis.1
MLAAAHFVLGAAPSWLPYNEPAYLIPDTLEVDDEALQVELDILDQLAAAVHPSPSPEPHKHPPPPHKKPPPPQHLSLIHI